jgi:hypothetical protein
MDTASESYFEVVVPVADYQDVVGSAFAPPRRPPTLSGKTIALIPNDKPFSPGFLEPLTQRFAGRTEIQRAYMYHPDWQFTHPGRVGKIAPEVDKLARECDLMISGVGD